MEGNKMKVKKREFSGTYCNLAADTFVDCS